MDMNHSDNLAKAYGQILFGDADFFTSNFQTCRPSIIRGRDSKAPEIFCRTFISLVGGNVSLIQKSKQARFFIVTQMNGGTVSTANVGNHMKRSANLINNVALLRFANYS